MKYKLPLAIAAAVLLSLAGFDTAQAAGSAASAEKTHITFADVGWDSAKLNNELAGLVAEHLYGYTWEALPGSTPIMHEAIMKGEIDINLEAWTNNIPSYFADLETGAFTELGVNFDDNYQGFYIPRYIADEYPDLKTVKDLADYAWLFPDPEDSSKGVIYGGIPGWGITEIMKKKVEVYGLDEYYNYVIPGSDAAMSATLTSAWDKKEPVVSYYWEPTWLLGKYDFVLLEDDPYDEARYEDGYGACPAVTVTVAVSNDFAASNPEYCEFLSGFGVPSAVISEALAYMQETGADHEATAVWLLTESHPELADTWLGSKQAEKLRGELSGKAEKKNLFSIDTDAIDTSVRAFAASADGILSAISGGLGGLVNGMTWILRHIPWFILVLAVALLSWRASGLLRKGVLYGFLFACIGGLGLWDMMLVTLSIVFSSVFIALLFGLPIGILISGSEKVNRIMRPILDTMQTMPVFVYLIPALLLFGMGNASAVIATVIYAIVPVIRLTSLGIRQVDKEVVEAAVSFGSTRWQTLFKVQIPQALPTIMTGVNQTLMMSMAMVVTCSMIGARGLGMEVLEAVNRIQIGRGLVAGACVVILAVILDRITQGWFADRKPAKKKKKSASGPKKGE